MTQKSESRVVSPDSWARQAGRAFSFSRILRHKARDLRRARQLLPAGFPQVARFRAAALGQPARAAGLAAGLIFADVSAPKDCRAQQQSTHTYFAHTTKSPERRRFVRQTPHSTHRALRRCVQIIRDVESISNRLRSARRECKPHTLCAVQPHCGRFAMRARSDKRSLM